MPANRISHLFESQTTDETPRETTAPAGFTAVPLQPLEDVSARWNELKILYEMAYLMARTGYLVEE